MGRRTSSRCPCRASEDRNGVRNKKAKRELRRAKLSRWFYGDNVPLPTAAELAEADAHIAHEVEATKPILAEGEALHVDRDEAVLHGDPALTAAAVQAAQSIEDERKG